MKIDNVASRNRTLVLSHSEQKKYESQFEYTYPPQSECVDKIFCADFLKEVNNIPENFIDLAVIDPPYNLTKNYDGVTFKQSSDEEYELWLNRWIPSVIKVLKKDGSLYICGDWVNSSALYRVLSKNCIIRNRITCERKNGRGSLSKWKNSSEDIWFCTKSNDYIFNLDAVKLKRKVIAPYKDEKGNPKDWDYEDGKGFRLTSPSNLWTDISVPFWSMPENTEHLPQKPEKLIAKLILASSNPGDIVLDGFLGSGTTAVVAKKLNRHFIGFEQSSRYACIALKRLEQANNASSIQGFDGQFFWERNTGIEQKKQKQQKSINESNTTLNKTSNSLF